MTKKVAEVESTIMSIAKAMPLLIGGVGSILVSPHGSGDGVVQRLAAGDWKNAENYAIANWTFYEPTAGTFQMNQGNGVKVLGAGLAVHKFLKWIL